MVSVFSRIIDMVRGKDGEICWLRRCSKCARASSTKSMKVIKMLQVLCREVNEVAMWKKDGQKRHASCSHFGNSRSENDDVSI